VGHASPFGWRVTLPREHEARNNGDLTTNVMRPKVIIVVLAAGFLAFGSLLAIRQGSNHSTKNSESTPISSAKDQPNDVPAPASQTAESTVSAPASSPASDQPKDSGEDAHRTYVEQRSEQLMDLAMNDDRTSLDTILSELTNRDPEIRKAALDATIQFGSRDAIPKLTDAASQTDDPNEKTAITDAIEFLKLPSLTEVMAHSTKPAGSQQVAKTSHKGALSRRVQPAPQPNQ
jgi:hypothetical protein